MTIHMPPESTLYRDRRSLVAADIERAMAIGCHDWNKRWKADWYVCRYRIGEVAEDLTFSRNEIPGAIEATTALARDPNVIVLGAKSLGDYLDCFYRESMSAIEAYVRHKHRLPVENRILTKHARPVVRSLVKTPPARRNESERHWWSMMLFGTMSGLRNSPADANCLIVDDEPPMSADLLKKSIFNPALSDERKAILMQGGLQFGGRIMTSMKINVG